MNSQMNCEVFVACCVHMHLHRTLLNSIKLSKSFNGIKQIINIILKKVSCVDTNCIHSNSEENHISCISSLNIWSDICYLYLIFASVRLKIKMHVKCYVKLLKMLHFRNIKTN